MILFISVRFLGFSKTYINHLIVIGQMLRTTINIFVLFCHKYNELSVLFWLHESSIQDKYLIRLTFGNCGFEVHYFK